MASRAEIAAMCRDTGLTVAADVYEPDSEDKGPHIVYRHEGTRCLRADGRAYAVRDSWSVTLYTKRYDPASEALVEAAFESAGLPVPDSMSGYDDEHRIHWTEWDFETIR